MTSGTATAARSYSFSVPPERAKASNAARGGAIAIGAQFVKLALQLANAVILARLLGPEDFGLIAMSAALMGLALFFTDLGLATATVQRNDLDARAVSALFFVNLAAGLVCLLFAWLAAPLLASVFGDPRLTMVIVVSALGIVFYALGAQHHALLLRDMRWGAVNAIAIASQFAGLVVGVCLAAFTEAGYWALVAAGLVAAVLSTGLAWIAVGWTPRWPGSFAPAMDMLRFGSGMMLIQILNWFHTSTDDVLLGWRGGAAQLGVYNRAYQLFIMPRTLISGPLQSVYVPLLSRLQDDPEAWKEAYLDALLALTLLSAGLGAILCFAADPIVTVIYGPQWGDVRPVFRVLVLSTFFASPAASCSWVLISLGKIRASIHWQVFASTIFVSAFAAGLPFGPIGVAWGYAASMLLLAPIYMIFTYFQVDPAFRPDPTKALAVCVPFSLWAMAVAAAFHFGGLFPGPAPEVGGFVLNGLLFGVALLPGLALAWMMSTHAQSLLSRAVDVVRPGVS